MNRAQVWLLLYLVAVVGITFVHQAGWLAGALGLALLAAGPARWRLLKRAVLALLLFNASFSLAYALVAWWQARPVADVLLLMNLRVLLLVFLGFWLVDRIKLLEALASWPLLAMIATLAIGQVAVYRRLLDDFRLAFRSRNPVSPTPVDLLRHAGAQGGALLDKSLHSADQVAQAMRSRGAFDA
jgi:cobalt/nickel transport system permease protein